jgi:hypothetical protein
LFLNPNPPGTLEYPRNCAINHQHVFGHAAIGSLPTFISKTPKPNFPKNFSNKKPKLQSSSNSYGAGLSVFKGKEAHLNFVAFQILAIVGPLTKYEIHRQLRTQIHSLKYSSVNRRIRALVEGSYVKQAGLKVTKAGFEAATYELTSRGYLAYFMYSMHLDLIIRRLSEEGAETVLGEFVTCSADLPIPHCTL